MFADTKFGSVQMKGSGDTMGGGNPLPPPPSDRVFEFLVRTGLSIDLLGSVHIILIGVRQLNEEDLLDSDQICIMKTECDHHSANKQK